MTRPSRGHTSTVKKSVATSTSICLVMNSVQVVSFLRSPAGGSPCLFSTFATVASLTRCPIFFRAPEIRSYPHVLFSLANLRISVSTCEDTGGRPRDRRCPEPSNFRATSLACQRRMVSGFAIVAMDSSAFRPSFLPRRTEYSQPGKTIKKM